MPTYTSTLTETVEWSDVLDVDRPYLFVTNSVRTSASTTLRFLGKPLRFVSIDLPPAYGQIEPGMTVWAAHDLLPEAPSGTDRYETWRLVPLYVLSVEDPIKPAVLKLTCLDLRERYCTWWSPMLTDIGMTDDLNGIAILDRAGGWNTVRDQVAYGVRPPGNDSYQEVLANKPIVDAYGLLIEGGDDENHLLNSTFSEGSGDTFTSWTKTTSGGATGVGWELYTLIDATGFRRAIQLVPTATGEDAYVTQAATLVGTGSHFMHARVYYKNGGAFDDLGIRIQRSDTSAWWRDSDASWQGATQTNAITPNSGVVASLRWVSKEMDLTGVAATMTVHVGHFSAAYNGTQITQLQGVELIEKPIQAGYYAYRSPLPTKAAKVTRVMNLTHIVNDSAVRVLSPTRGFVKLSFTPHWSHEDVEDDTQKYLWCADFDGITDTQFLRCLYNRLDSTTAQWQFFNGTDTASLEVTGADLANRDQTYEVVCRWTSEEFNEYGTEGGQVFDIWVDGVRGVPFTNGAAERVADATCNVGIGSSVTLNEEEFADAHFTAITISDHVPTEAEILRL